MQSNQRPLSPHLQVYRPQWSSVLSILHRISGLVLSVGTVLVVAWLVGLAQGEQAFAAVRGFLRHPLVLMLLIGWTLALFYHLLNGIRHLLWDTGALLELGPARTSGWIVVVASFALTAIVWGVAL
jgi:succinate dehydrogenase / fumarate reductase cytochrome b subunit